MSLMGYNERGARVGQRFYRCALAAMALAFVSGTLALNGAGPDWRMIGYDSEDNRTQPFERRIGVDNVSHLAKKWVAFTAGDVSATPAVVDGAVYFGDFGGMEAQRRHWRRDLVAQDFGLHRDRRRHFAHQSDACRRHAGDRRSERAEHH